MKTTKPIGTISYNTPNYLSNLLSSLWRDGILDDYRAVFHYAEEEGKKDHFHLNLFPSSRIDTTDLRKRFEEPDPVNKLPLSCEPFRYSEPLNWLLYVLHDQDYLLSHPKENDGDGKQPYTLPEIVTPYRDLLQRDYMRACNSVRENVNQIIMRKASEGKRFMEILAEVPTANPISLNAILSGMYRDLHEFHGNAIKKDD